MIRITWAEVTRRSPSTFSTILALCVALCALLGPSSAAHAGHGNHHPPLETPFIGASYDDGFTLHSAGGDDLILFAVQTASVPGQPLGIYATKRQNGDFVGDVTPPPGGWTTPVSIYVDAFSGEKKRSAGSFLVLDAGGNPDAVGRLTVLVHRFHYSYDFKSGLESEWISSHPVPIEHPLPEVGSGLLYAGAFTMLPGGEVAVADTIAGDVWVSDPEITSWQLMWRDPTLGTGTGESYIGVGRDGAGGTRAYEFQVPPTEDLGLYPGIHGITYADATDEVCVVRAARPGGIWCLSRSALVNPLIPALGESLHARTVVPPEEGMSDMTNGLTYDRYHPDSPWLYWQRAIADEKGGGLNLLRRVHLLTGEIEVVAGSNELYDFTNEIAPLPPLRGAPVNIRERTLIASSMGQLHNNPEVNVLLGGVATFVAPSLVTLVYASSD